MIRFSALLILPLFALACGATPNASTDDEVESARQALENGESEVAESVQVLETEEIAPLALVAADAGAAPVAPEAPEAPVGDEEPAPQEDAPVGDAGAPPEVPEVPEAPVPCTEHETRRMDAPNDGLIETCMQGGWTLCLSSTCPFSPFWDPNGPVPNP